MSTNNGTASKKCWRRKSCEATSQRGGVAAPLDVHEEILGDTTREQLFVLDRKPLFWIDPSPLNDEIYRPIDEDDPLFQDLVKSIREYGVLTPITTTIDGMILSGHRRRRAAELAGVDDVKVQVYPIHSSDEADCLKLIRHFNHQRRKSDAEEINESVLDAINNPLRAYEKLIKKRHTKPSVDLAPVELGERKERRGVGPRKRDMLNAVRQSLESRKDFLPASLRAIHYDLLSLRPLKDTSKPDSFYGTGKNDYRNLSALATEARYEGLIPMDAIDDDTRVTVELDCHPTASAFIDREMKGLFDGYWRDLLQSQRHHVEVMCEKHTVGKIVKSVTLNYCVPLSVGRGFSSPPPMRDLANRYSKSGKDGLILIFVTDFDPEGEDIARAFAQTMRDEFHIGNITARKAALTKAQVEEFNLPTELKAKKDSPRYKKFVAKYGEDVYELEALKPNQLQRILKDALESVLDMAAFHREQDQEAKDAARIEGIRLSAIHSIHATKEIGGDFEEPEAAR